MKIIIEIPKEKDQLKQEILQEITSKLPYYDIHFAVSPNASINASAIPEGDDQTAKKEIAHGALSQVQKILFRFQ